MPNASMSSASAKTSAEIRVRIAREPDEAAALDGRETHQRPVALLDAGKTFGARNGEQVAVRAVGPGMVGADDPLRRDDLVAFDQPGSAMAADVRHDMRLAPRRRARRSVERHSRRVQLPCCCRAEAPTGRAAAAACRTACAARARTEADRYRPTHRAPRHRARAVSRRGRSRRPVRVAPRSVARTLRACPCGEKCAPPDARASPIAHPLFSRARAVKQETNRGGD